MPEDTVSFFLNDPLLTPLSIFNDPFCSENPRHSFHCSSSVLLTSRPVKSLNISDSSFNLGINSIFFTLSGLVFKVGTLRTILGLAVHTQNPRDAVLCSDEDFHHVCVWKLRLVEQAAHSAFAVRQLPVAGVLQFLTGHSCPQGPWGWAV